MSILDNQVQNIKHCCKSIYYNNDVWVKKDPKKEVNFDIPMGLFDRAETCELVELFILQQLNEMMKITDYIEKTTSDSLKTTPVEKLKKIRKKAFNFLKTWHLTLLSIEV